MTAPRARRLKDLPASPFLPFVPTGVAEGLALQGFELKAHAQAFVGSGGLVTVRMVWRKTRAADSVVMALRLRGRIPDLALNVLAAALEPRAGAHGRV